jgi:3'-5' exoribonuclease
MKTPFVADLATEQIITTFFLVHARELRNTREGKQYLRLELGDRSGTVEARMWDQFETAAKDVARDDIVKVQARVEIYRNRPQLAILQVRRARPEEVDIADFLPHTKEDVGKLWAQLGDYAGSITDPWLKKLVANVLGNPAVADAYKRAPAAKTMHHAYLGGLLDLDVADQRRHDRLVDPLAAHFFDHLGHQLREDHRRRDDRVPVAEDERVDARLLEP